MRKLFTPVFLFISSFIILFSCKKTDTVQDETALPVDKFFSVDPNAPKEIKAIAKALNKQNDQYGYLSSIIKRAGYPRWDKAVIANFDKGTLTARGGEEISGEIVYIPFARDSDNFVNSLLTVKINATDTIYRMLYANNYRAFGYDTSNHNKWNARDVFNIFTSFDHSVFGHTKFWIRDSNLFKPANDSSYIIVTRVSGTTNRTTARVSSYTLETCGTFNVCNSSGPAPQTTLLPARITEDCSTVEICTTFYYGGGSDGTGSTGGWTGTGDGTGGSGGGTGWYGEPTSVVTCASAAVQRSSFIQPTSGCGSGWVAVDGSRTLNGLTYTVFNYPGKDYGLPWLWWEDGVFLQSYGGINFGSWAIDYLSTNPNLSFSIFHNQFMSVSEGQDDTYDANYWDDPNLAFPSQNLPSWNGFSNAYPSNKTAAEVYELVGGIPKALRDGVLNDSDPTNDGDFNNACALRVSRALNYSGVTIPNIPGQTYKGGDGKYYFLGAKKLNIWMRKTFGTNPATSTTPYNANHYHYTASQAGEHGVNLPGLLKDKKGIYSLVSSNPNWASGHGDILYDNTTCDNNCHFYDAPIDYIDVWQLQ